MEITFVWSWFSFVVGALSSVVAAFILAVVFSFKQWRKQQKVAKMQSDNIEKMFSTWGGRDNSPL